MYPISFDKDFLFAYRYISRFICLVNIQKSHYRDTYPLANPIQDLAKGKSIFKICIPEAIFCVQQAVVEYYAYLSLNTSPTRTADKLFHQHHLPRLSEAIYP